MKRIYLAKSNRSNPDLVSKVRQTLSLYDVNVVEFNGGAYSHKQLLECEYLVVVPDLTNIAMGYSEEVLSIGKGLFEQIEIFERNCNYGDNIIVISDESMMTKQIIDVEIADEDDYINYGALQLSNYGEFLENSLNDFAGKKTFDVTSKTISKFYHLLVKRR